MIRTAIPRTLPRPSVGQQCPMAARFTSCTSRPLLKSALRNLSNSLHVGRARPLALTPYQKTFAVARRYASVQIIPGTDGPLVEREKRRQQDLIAPDPEHVSADSSVHPMFGEINTPEPEKEQEEDMMKGLKGDFVSQKPCILP